MDDVGIFFGAVSLDSALERADFLREHAGSQGRMRREVESLLRVHDSLACSSQNQDDQSEGSPSRVTSELSLDFLNPSDLPNSLGRLDQYEIVKVVRFDSASIVLEGFDTRLKRVVAIHALGDALRHSDLAREQFRRVADAAAAISSAHVVRVLGGGEQNQTPYLVAEVTPGRTLQQRLVADGSCSTAETIRIAKEAAQGLADIHTAGLLHHNIHPGSIFLAGAEERVKFTGHFAAPFTPASDVGSVDDIACAAEYMSPEQVRNEPLKERSDLFSLGVVIHAMTSGVSPFASSTASHAKRRICEESPPPIRDNDPDAPAWLEDVVARLLVKAQEQRPSSALDLLLRFADHLAPASKIDSPPAVNTPHRPRTSWRTRLGRVCDWTVRIAAICIVLALTTIVLVHRYAIGPHSKPLGPLWGMVIGIGALNVQVDDPGVEVTVTSPNWQSRWSGSHCYVVPPNEYTVIARLDGEPIFNKGITLHRWEEVDILINAEEALRALQEKDPDGYAARWLFRRGGTVGGYWHAEVRCTDTVQSYEQLPSGHCFLESVELRNLTPADLAVACRLLAACPRLRSLRIRDSTLSGASLRHFAQIVSLQKLELTHVFEADRDDFLTLSRLPSLEVISLNYSPHVHAFCNAVGDMPHIRSVTITDCPMTDVMLPALCKRTSFETVTILSRFLTDASMDHLSKVESLHRLELRSPLLTEEIWGKLAGLPSLQSLKVGGFPAISKQRLVGGSFQAPPRLRELTLVNVAIDDRLLDTVSEMPQLTLLRFEDSTAEGISLQRLACLSDLKSLQFVDMSVSHDELWELQNDLPNCEVVRLSDDSTLR
jgi:serine/threonine protein kinase